jgi:hypothetical protein
MRHVLPLLTLVCATVSTASADDRAHQSKPQVSPSNAARIVWLSKLPFRITRPGVYVLNRDWQLPIDLIDAGNGTVIEIEASNVVLDFRGHSIEFEVGTGIVVEGDWVTIRNGRLREGFDWHVGSAIESNGRGTVIDNMEIAAVGGISFNQPSGVLRNSKVGARDDALWLSSHTLVEHSDISCVQYCVKIGDRNTIIDSSIAAEGALTIYGNDNELARNRIYRVAEVLGDGNLLRDNTTVDCAEFFVVYGTANVLDGNIKMPRTDCGLGVVGIRFLREGNFYGNNRMGKSDIPFELNGTTQVDWGGNVGF